jgi:LysM repeat protein
VGHTAATQVAPNPSPALSSAPIETRGSYTVKSGDTAWGIARRHKISADDLLKANGITDARKLRIGMKLSIPAN